MHVSDPCVWNNCFSRAGGDQKQTKACSRGGLVQQERGRRGQVQEQRDSVPELQSREFFPAYNSNCTKETHVLTHMC